MWGPMGSQGRPKSFQGLVWEDSGREFETNSGKSRAKVPQSAENIDFQRRPMWLKYSKYRVNRMFRRFSESWRLRLLLEVTGTSFWGSLAPAWPPLGPKVAAQTHQSGTLCATCAPLQFYIDFTWKPGSPRVSGRQGVCRLWGCGKTAFWHLDSDITMCLLIFGRTGAV